MKPASALRIEEERNKAKLIINNLNESQMYRVINALLSYLIAISFTNV